jgi:membrane carboxypeptidase/penicillin-binding protein
MMFNIRMEAAMVAIDPTSGAVRVLIGGRDYYDDSFNHTEVGKPAAEMETNRWS